jgi:radical SAM superfamily enzyme YgiQ (UPF0313 family)
MDLIICIVPKIEPEAPTVGPALLKACVERHGFNCQVKDFNIELYRYLEKKNLEQKYYYQNDLIFNCAHTNFSQEFIEFYEEHKDIFISWANELVAANPRWVGLSLLSRWSQACAVKLSQLIRERSNTIKIVWGGSQIPTHHEEYQDFIDKKLIDCFINGDAEHAIVDLLKIGETAGSINTKTPIQIANLKDLPVPNYDDIKWEQYHKSNERTVYITASRGCVKRCSFCNVRDIWPEFYTRDPDSVANEIRQLIKKYKRINFKFTDSLINGNMKVYRQLLLELSAIKKENKEFTWLSQWIVRSASQSPESDYKLLAESGCVDLEIGIESFSEEVRWHMGKKFTNKDFWWCLDQLKKYKIPSAFLMISGYPTETQRDHRLTIKTIKRLYKERYVFDYRKNRYIWFSFTPMLLADELVKKLDKKCLTEYKDVFEWTYKDNNMERRLANYNEILSLIENFESSNRHWTKNKMLEIYEKKANY